MESWGQKHVWSEFKRDVLTLAALFVPVIVALFGTFKKSDFFFFPDKNKI